jgi:hypothetical protein
MYSTQSTYYINVHRFLWTCMNVYKYVSLSDTEIVASQSFPPTHRGVDVNACSCICKKTLRVANTTTLINTPNMKPFCVVRSRTGTLWSVYIRELRHPSVDSTKSAVDLHLVPALVAGFKMRQSCSSWHFSSLS